MFIFQWLFDEAQMDADNVGAPVTQQQWDYIHNMGDALRQSFENVTAVFAPSCISHSVLTKRDWLSVKIDDISVAQALHCWEEHPLKLRKHRRKSPPMFSDEPSLVDRQIKRLARTEPDSSVQTNKLKNISNKGESTKLKRRRKKKRRRNRKNKKNNKRKGK